MTQANPLVELVGPELTGSWLAPRDLWLDGDRIRWDPLGGFRLVEGRPGLVDEFAKLALVSDAQLGQAVFHFAQKWGPLTLCDSAACQGYHPLFLFGSLPVVPTEMVIDAPPFASDRSRHMEFLLDWRSAASALGALRRIVWNLQLEDLGRNEDWKALLPAEKRPVVHRWRTVKDQRVRIADGITKWLASSHVMEVLRWDTEWPTLHLRSACMSAALAIEMALVPADVRPMVTCVECGIVWRPRRRLRVDPPLCSIHRVRAQKRRERAARASLG